MQVFFGGISGQTGEFRGQHRGKGLHRRFNRHFRVMHAQPLYHFTGIIEADLRCVGRRHHHRANPFRTQGIDGHTERQCRIDTTRHAEQDAGKAVFAAIVAHAEDQRLIGTGFDAQRWLQRSGLQAASGKIDDFQCFLERRQATAHAAFAVLRERSSLKNHFILPTDQVAQHRRQAASLVALSAQLERRRIKHQSQVSTRRGRGSIGTDGNGTSDTTNIQLIRRVTRHKIAQLILRKRLFAESCHAAPGTKQARRIETVPVLSQGMTDQDVDFRQGCRQCSEFLSTGGMKILT